MLTAWNNYLDNKQIDPKVPPLVANSWRRCHGRISPTRKIIFSQLNSTNLLAAQVASFDLISLARPVLEDIYQIIQPAEVAIILINGAGYILDLIASPQMEEKLRGFGIGLGTACSEQQIGTNALGLALIERQPVAVSGAEHYCIQFHNFSAAAAPVFDINGRQMGVVGLVTFEPQYQPYSLGLVAAGAKAIESQRQADHMLADYNTQLEQLTVILETISEGIVVWNGEGNLIHYNQKVAKMLEYPLHTLLGKKTERILKFPAFLVKAYENRQPLTDVEATITVGGNTVMCFLSLRFIYKKDELEWIIAIFRPIHEVRQLVQREVGAHATYTMDDILGESNAIKQIRKLVKTASSATASILIRGEMGTGRNILASAIHNESQRRDGAYLIFPLSPIPNELILIELIGYEEGGFSKHSGSRPSKFELAQGGTLYIQDVDLLPPEAQSALLNMLEMKVFHRLGSDRPIPVDVRVIVSTSADIEKLVAERRFRADLYYRLSTFTITLPPLRKRAEDIPAYVDSRLERLSAQLGSRLSLKPGVTEVFYRYPWPGNIRELEAVLSLAAIQAGSSGVIGLEHIPDKIIHPRIIVDDNLALVEIQPLSEVERKALQETAALWRGNLTQMAQSLGISRTTLWRKIKKYEIVIDGFNPDSL